MLYCATVAASAAPTGIVEWFVEQINLPSLPAPRNVGAPVAVRLDLYEFKTKAGTLLTAASVHRTGTVAFSGGARA